MKKSKAALFFSNLWYYYKWHLLVGALVLFALAVTVSQCAKKEDPDVSIVYVGDIDIGKTNREGMEKSLADLFDDVNGDGKKNLDVTFMGESESETKERLQVEVVAGEHNVYCVTKEIFDWLLQYNVLAPISDVLGEASDGVVDGYGVELKCLDIAEEPGFNAMPRNTILCLRANADNGVFDYKNATPFYKNSADFFIKACRYKKDGFRRETVRMSLIGDRDLYQNCIDDMEETLYFIGKRGDPDVAPILEYDGMQLFYKEGTHVFGNAEKERAEEAAKGGKLLLLDTDAYAYLAEKGLLLDISALGIGLPDGAEQYGVPLRLLDLSDTLGFYYADDWSNSRIYLCASADIEGYAAELLGYLYSFKN